MKIVDVAAYPILDSRGRPTVEVEVRLECGATGRGVAPAGASSGQYEAHELRDGDPARFRGYTVDRAVQNVREIIAPAAMGRDASDQAGVDRRLCELDGTPNKCRLGANAVLPTSMAVAVANAACQGVPLHESLGAGAGYVLPLPEIQILGGGAHASRQLDLQDLMVMPIGASSFFEALEMTFNVYAAVGDLLARRGQQYGVADEGGFWPTFPANEAALELLTEGISAAGHAPGRDVGISLDIAACELFDAESKLYRLALENRSFTSEKFAELIAAWERAFPIVSIEDPMSDDDHAGWQHVNALLGDRCQLVGDDLFTTNVARINAGAQAQLANAVLIKLNQIGTVSETLEAIQATRAAGWAPIISARSGETEDAFISHLAVATNAGQLKVGSITRGERTAKWNEVLRIERSLGTRGEYVGARALR